MIDLDESMGPAQDQTRNPCIWSQMRNCSQTRYQLCYVARYLAFGRQTKFVSKLDLETTSPDAKIW